MYEIFLMYAPWGRTHLGFYPNLAAAERAAYAIHERAPSVVVVIAKSRPDEPLPNGAVMELVGRDVTFPYGPEVDG